MGSSGKAANSDGFGGSFPGDLGRSTARDFDGLPIRDASVEPSPRSAEDWTAVTPHRTDCRTLLSTPVIRGQRSLLTDRIVLIGGTYLAGRDFQPTVVGSMAGVYVWAEAIASWVRHDALCEPRAGIVFALELLIGVLTGFLLVRFGPAFGLLYSLLIVGPLSVLFSLLTFGDRILFISFLPSCVAVCAHYQVEVHRELRELRIRLGRGEDQRERASIPDSAETPAAPSPSTSLPHPSDSPAESGTRQPSPRESPPADPGPGALP